jgi:hypothetical protein
MNYTFTFKLISSINYITLPVSIKTNKLTIKKLSYRFIKDGDYILSVNIDKFNDKLYYDGVNNYYYTFNIFNNGNSNIGINYFNSNTNPDIVLNKIIDMNKINISISINGNLTNDININNPLFLELNFN